MKEIVPQESEKIPEDLHRLHQRIIIEEESGVRYMKKVNTHEIGMILGATFGLFHAFWSLLVAMGWAGMLLDFVFSLHFLDNPYTLQPFDLTRAVMLVIVTSVVGYVVGFVFSTMWNMMGKKK